MIIVIYLVCYYHYIFLTFLIDNNNQYRYEGGSVSEKKARNLFITWSLIGEFV